MTYQVLARKWRPKDFSTLKGQAVVVQALSNALRQKRMHHAYLFTGTRGVGKTTIARILAKCLNCEKGMTPDPCHTCNACLQIAEGRYLDLIEVDAASKTKVEDTRELLDNIQYAPSQGKYKIYLIDEVHMLSNHSFNALLKTLEEPPAHCVFLLATTDPQKLPATVISRCLQFKLSSMQEKEIIDYLAYILKEENKPFEERALQHLAYAAKGSMRDALSLLDQAIAYGNETVMTSTVRDMLSLVKTQPLIELMTAIHAYDATAVLQLIQDLASAGCQFDRLLVSLVSLLHTLAMRQVVPEYHYQDFDNSDQLDVLHQSIPAETLQLYYQVALTGQRDLPLSPSAQNGFEMIALRMLVLTSPSGQHDHARSVSGPNDGEKKSTASPPAASIKKPAIETPSDKINQQVNERTPRSEQPTESSASLPHGLNESAWPDFVESLGLKGLTKGLLSNCSFVNYKENVLRLAIKPQHQALLNDKQIVLIEAAISEKMGHKHKCHIEVTDQAQATPQEIGDAKALKMQKRAEQDFTNDAQVQSLLKTFDGHIVSETVEAVDS